MQNKISKNRKTIRKESTQDSTVWIFGFHAVKYALLNEKRKLYKLLVSENAFKKLSHEILNSRVLYEIVNFKIIKLPIPPESVHQGAILKVKPLTWGSVSEVCKTTAERSVVVLLDRVYDPQNVGAILRSAQIFRAKAVIASRKHSPPETGAIAKAASGALEWQPYLRIPNLAQTISRLKKMDYMIVGLDASAEKTLEIINLNTFTNLALVFGSEGLGMRRLTTDLCDFLVKINTLNTFTSLNLSNAVAISLYASNNT